MRALEQLPDFADYLRVCRSHESVGKNDLSALLIAPMQHQCRYQLMLEVPTHCHPNTTRHDTALFHRKCSGTPKTNLRRTCCLQPSKPLWCLLVSICLGYISCSGSYVLPCCYEECNLIGSLIYSLTEELEANIEENKRSAELLELQETLCWPTLAQLDPTAYIPEVIHIERKTLHY